MLRNVDKIKNLTVEELIKDLYVKWIITPLAAIYVNDPRIKAYTPNIYGRIYQENYLNGHKLSEFDFVYLVGTDSFIHKDGVWDPASFYYQISDAPENKLIPITNSSLWSVILRHEDNSLRNQSIQLCMASNYFEVWSYPEIDYTQTYDISSGYLICGVKKKFSLLNNIYKYSNKLTNIILNHLKLYKNMRVINMLGITPSYLF